MDRWLTNIWRYLQKPHDEDSRGMRLLGSVLVVAIAAASIFFVVSSPMFFYSGQPEIGVWVDIGIVTLLVICLLAALRKSVRLIFGDMPDRGKQEQVD